MNQQNFANFGNDLFSSFGDNNTNQSLNKTSPNSNSVNTNQLNQPQKKIELPNVILNYFFFNLIKKIINY
jgi:hypothetical protein